MAGVDQAVNQAKQFWAGLNGRQRMLLGGGVALTIGLLAMFTRMMSTPEYKPLMVGLEPADAQALSAQLAAKNIAFQMGPDGKSINVPADQLDAARLQAASQDGPRSGRMGFELFDKVSWGQTEFDEKVNYQRALEGELERTIGTLSDVKSARVHLVLSKSSVFLDRERGAKASVTLKLKRGSLSKDQLGAISRLVSGAVDDLAPVDVAIIDADSNESLGPNTNDGNKGDEIEQQLSKRLMATLGPALGADNLRASVNVEFDTTAIEESQDKYDPAVSAVLTSQKSEEQVGAGAGTGGVPGTSSNLPNASAGSKDAAMQDGAQSSKSDNSTFGVNKIVRHTVSPAGRVRRITAAVLVNDAIERHQEKGKWIEVGHKRSAAELKQISDLAGAAIGLDTTRGDVITVENMPFDRAATADVAPVTMAEKIHRGLTDYSTAVRYAALLALFLMAYLLMIRPMQKRIFTATPLLPAGVATAALPSGEQTELGAGKVDLIESDAGTNAIKRHLVDMAQTQPDAMNKAVQAWLREDLA